MTVDTVRVATMWAGWRRGVSASRIAAEVGVKPGWIRLQLREVGGIQPPPRKPRAGSLTLQQRERIFAGVHAGLTNTEIAEEIGVHGSTVGRELGRNGGRGDYRPSQAHQQALDRARRPQQGKLDTSRVLRALVASKLRLFWSPQQIAAWLRERFPDRQDLWVSHETIYRALFVQARGTFRQDLTAYLRSKRDVRHPRGVSPRRGRAGVGQLRDMELIRDRPAEVADRAVPGHWEGDLLLGSGPMALITLVERTSRFLLLAPVPSRKTADVIPVLTELAMSIPEAMRRSLAWDRGKEMGDHTTFTMATDMKVYFCDPHAPWQRGSNENTNGLLRDFFPKRTDQSVHDRAYIDHVAFLLNTRPRQTLGWQTPAKTLAKLLASTP